MNSKTKQIKPKKRKIRYDRIILFLSIVFFIVICFTYFLNLKISNIYILNNNYLTDQEIIEIAQISDYPATLKNLSIQIKNRLEDNIYIKSAKVRKKGLTKVYIEIEEKYKWNIIH